ncbi:hypothetical protein FF38_10255 [Lucilia cuprina]|uniref:Uncharacterized protein n=1 Tax=Lucilia cuprina TaxID=7375 RepID=A0A0L0BVC5_LUCCU|nr:hypothetical protein FF38_10255 [Lucilia cuprina]
MTLSTEFLNLFKTTKKITTINKMLPTNVMTFMKKMVATDENASTQNTTDTGGTFGKLKQTLSSSLLTAQDRVNKMSPRPSLIPTDTDATYGNYQQQQDAAANQNNNNNNNTTSTITSATSGSISSGGGTSNSSKQNTEPGRRAGACRVCLKSFKPDDFHKTCFECQQRVCEDCASYMNKMSPRPSLIPTDTDATYGNYQQQQDAAANQNNNNNNNTTSTITSATSGSISSGGGTSNSSKQNTEPGRRAGACRVCLKSFKPDDFHKTCFECQQRVCEDCASYSKLEENEDAVSLIQKNLNNKTFAYKCGLF